MQQTKIQLTNKIKQQWQVCFTNIYKLETN